MNVTRWFPPHVDPVRPGMYQAQDTNMRCNCCWIEIYWTGKEWRSTLHSPGYWRTLFFKSQLRRWRGLSAPTNTQGEPQ